MKRISTMTEVSGSLATINGQFAVIDRTNEKEDGQGYATLVNVFSEDETLKNFEIDDLMGKFVIDGGYYLKVGNTGFSFSLIKKRVYRNKLTLTVHKDDTKMVVVKNKETEEYFLLISEEVGIASAKEFLKRLNAEISAKSSEGLCAPEKNLDLPNINKKAMSKIEKSCGVRAIKLRTI